MFGFRAQLLLLVLQHPTAPFGRGAENSLDTDKYLGGQKGSVNEEEVVSVHFVKIAATVKSTAVTVNPCALSGGNPVGMVTMPQLMSHFAWSIIIILINEDQHVALCAHG